MAAPQVSLLVAQPLWRPLVSAAALLSFLRTLFVVTVEHEILLEGPKAIVASQVKESDPQLMESVFFEVR